MPTEEELEQIITESLDRENTVLAGIMLETAQKDKRKGEQN